MAGELRSVPNITGLETCVGGDGLGQRWSGPSVSRLQEDGAVQDLSSKGDATPTPKTSVTRDQSFLGLFKCIRDHKVQLGRDTLIFTQLSIRAPLGKKRRISERM